MQNFETIAEAAKDARETGDLDEAIEKYRRGVALRPRWNEGWWYLATILYERDEYEEATRAFKRVVALNPKVGTPLVMLGLCEYRLGRYDDAFTHLQQGKQLGIGNNKDLDRVMRYHEGTLFLLKSDFETAEQVFKSLSFDGFNSQDLIIGTGLAALRISMLPRQIDVGHRDRDMIRRAGLAQHYFSQLNAADARVEFDRLVKDYPGVSGVQYAYGRFMILMRDYEAAVKAFEREIENTPTHALARLQIAYIRLSEKDPQGALPIALKAIELNQRQPLAYYILGRIYTDLNKIAEAITQLEMARSLAPNEPRIHYALFRAYAKANRKADADLARETFERLNKMDQEASQRGVPRGQAIEERDPQ
ncbi:MAG: tetratricopeptide repeat protein [Acidobacteriota bacterium]|nr:MAG: tetratricopeptide repeat protein [Acidobacteriota bacterium]